MNLFSTARMQFVQKPSNNSIVVPLIAICLCMILPLASNGQIVTLIDIIGNDHPNDSTANTSVNRTVQIFPNPVATYATIVIPGSPVATQIELLSGSYGLLQSISLGALPEQSWTFQLNANSLNVGTYYLRLIRGGNTRLYGIVVAR